MKNATISSSSRGNTKFSYASAQGSRCHSQLVSWQEESRPSNLRRKVLTCLGDPSRAGKKIAIPSQGIGPAFSLRILHATES
jgi:hypothetical protein